MYAWDSQETVEPSWWRENLERDHLSCLINYLKKQQHFAEAETSCVITDVCQVQNKRGLEQKIHKQAGKKQAS